MRFYQISSARPWGGYGKVLIGGICRSARQRRNQASAGAFGPVYASDHVSRDRRGCCDVRFQNALEPIGSHHLAFAPVIKAKIVELRWDEWDRGAADPANIRSQATLRTTFAIVLTLLRPPMRLGDLWEVLLPEDGDVRAVRLGRGAWEFNSIRLWSGEVAFVTRTIYCRGCAKAWLEGMRRVLTFVETACSKGASSTPLSRRPPGSGGRIDYEKGGGVGRDGRARLRLTMSRVSNLGFLRRCSKRIKVSDETWASPLIQNCRTVSSKTPPIAVAVAPCPG